LEPEASDIKISLATCKGCTAYTLTGFDKLARSGQSVAFGGDLNGDGIDDLAIGASSASPNSNRSAGQGYVVFGGNNVGSGGVYRLRCREFLCDYQKRADPQV